MEIGDAANGSRSEKNQLVRLAPGVIFWKTRIKFGLSLIWLHVQYSMDNQLVRRSSTISLADSLLNDPGQISWALLTTVGTVDHTFNVRR